MSLPQEAVVSPKPSPPSRISDLTWQLPWLSLQLTARNLRLIPTTSYAWPAAKRALEQCAELERRMLQTGWFN